MPCRNSSRTQAPEASFRCGEIPSAESSLSPLEIWCNEAQERYVLAIDTDDLEGFAAICARERCPFAVVGETTAAQRLLLRDGTFRQ